MISFFHLLSLIIVSSFKLFIFSPRPLAGTQKLCSLVSLHLCAWFNCMLTFYHSYLLLTFLCRPSGIEFSMDFPATVELQIGDVVTIDYKNYFHNEVPVEPCITRVRSDLKWEEVLNDYLSERPQHKHLNGIILTLSLLPFRSPVFFFQNHRLILWPKMIVENPRMVCLILHYLYL